MYARRVTIMDINIKSKLSIHDQLNKVFKHLKAKQKSRWKKNYFYFPFQFRLMW